MHFQSPKLRKTVSLQPCGEGCVPPSPQLINIKRFLAGGGCFFGDTWGWLRLAGRGQQLLFAIKEMSLFFASPGIKSVLFCARMVMLKLCHPSELEAKPVGICPPSWDSGCWLGTWHSLQVSSIFVLVYAGVKKSPPPCADMWWPTKKPRVKSARCLWSR